MVALIGQILTACAQPFLLYSPTTLAAVWFGPKERAICTNLASVGKCMHGVCVCVCVCLCMCIIVCEYSFVIVIYNAQFMARGRLTRCAF